MQRPTCETASRPPGRDWAALQQEDPPRRVERPLQIEIPSPDALAARGEGHRKRILVPESAHGTNPATAAFAGFTVDEVPAKPDAGGFSCRPGGADSAKAARD